MWINRPYQPSDLRWLCDFVSQCQQRSSIPSEYMHAGDVVWGIQQNTAYQPERDVWLWEVNSQIVGFVLQKRLTFYVTVAPWLSKSQQKELLTEMLHHAENHARQYADPIGRLEVDIAQTDGLSREVLESNGYSQGDSMMHSSERSLADIPEVALPEGFAVRHPNQDELEKRVELHRTVWHPSRVTLESHLSLRNSPMYRPDLDLVVVSPEGAFVAYCIVWYDPQTQTGEFEPVGTHPNWRGKGLGKAVLLEGFRRLKALGAKKAIVYFYPDNLSFYQSAGFKEANQWLRFSKPL